MVLPVAMGTIPFEQRSWHSLRAKKPPLVTDSLYVTCFLAETKSLLSRAPQSECPSLLLKHM